MHYKDQSTVLADTGFNTADGIPANLNSRLEPGADPQGRLFHFAQFAS